MLKLCTLTSPGKRIKNIVGLVTLMSHVGHERTTRDNNLCQSSLPQSLSVSQWRGGGGGGNEQEGYFTMQPMGLGQVIPSLGRS